MNIQEYILSGIVESYVLGLADEAERTEFEQLCTQYPELVAARTAFELEVEKSIMANSVAPPATVKHGFLEVIQSNSSNQPKIVTMQNANAPARRNSGSLFLAAAAIVLLIGCAWLAYHFYSQTDELKNSNAKLEAKLNTADSLLQQIIAEQKAVVNPEATVVNMVGTKVAPKSSANIYWDSVSTNVYLVVRNMPKLPTDQQYQLWALINGQPKDLGVFDVPDKNVILKMNNTQKAQAFAITIEKKGGNPSPTLEKMQSMGNVKQGL